MSDTPRTDIMVSGNSDPQVDEYEELAAFTRQLERELNELQFSIDCRPTKGDLELEIEDLKKKLDILAEKV